MFKVIKFFYFSTLIFCIIAIPGMFAYGFFYGFHTEYCPWSHKFNSSAHCIVLIKVPHKVMIHHANLRLTSDYLEILHKGKSTHYVSSERISRLKSEDTKVKFMPETESSILVDEKPLRLTRLKRT